VTEIIRQRFSCRAYQKIPIADQQAKQLEAFARSITTGPFNTTLRFELVVAAAGDQNALKGLGTYGAIQDPAGFIIGAAGSGEMNLIDYGYGLETVILYATSIGLGTCWLGGNFTKSSFSKRIKAAAGEVVPAVSPTGYPTDEIRTRDRMRIKVKSDTRLPWEPLFFKSGTGDCLSQEDAGGYALPLDMLRLAPSAHNYQPWRVVQDDSCYQFYLKRTQGYGPGNLTFILLDVVDLQRMEIGIAMCHFELAARELGLDGRWQANDPGLQLPGGAEYIATWVTT
jgi:nitroreductase